VLADDGAAELIARARREALRLVQRHRPKLYQRGPTSSISELATHLRLIAAG
jgi:hypothetical protein